MMDRRCAEFAREAEVSKLLRDADWRDGLIGDAAYTASLLGLGYSYKDAQTELSLLKMTRPARVDEQLEASRRWLAQRKDSAHGL